MSDSNEPHISGNSGTAYRRVAVATALILLVIAAGAAVFTAQRRISRREAVQEAVQEELKALVLPTIGPAAPPAGPQKLIVNLSVTGETTVKGQKLDEAQLRECLADYVRECRSDPEHPREPAVLIRGQAGVSWKPHMERIMKLCAAPDLKIHSLKVQRERAEDPARRESPSEESD